MSSLFLKKFEEELVMKFCKGLQLLCDICFYMTFANILGGIFGATMLWITLPIFVLSAFLVGLFVNTKLLKYFAVLVVALCFLVIPLNVANVTLISLPIIYMFGWLVVNKVQIEIEYAPVFKLYLILLVSSAFLVMFFDVGPLFIPFMLPFVAVFIVGSITLMRLARHDVVVTGSNKLKVANMAYVALVMFVAIAATPQLVVTILSNLYFRVIGPIIIWPIMAIVSFFIYIFGFGYRFLDMFEQDFSGFGRNGIVGPSGEQQTDPTRATYIFLIIITALILAFIIVCIVFVIKKVRDNDILKMDLNSGVYQSRHNFSEKEYLKMLKNNKVRRIYRKFLVLCKKRGIYIERNTTSLDVERLSTEELEGFKSDEMRDIYLKVRYGEKGYSKENVNAIMKAYNEAKKAKH